MDEPSFGVELYQYVDAPTSLAEAELAERLGFDSFWLGDSQLLWRDVYVLLGAAAVRTQRIGLAIGVTNPLTRHPTVTASAAATLQELAPGRLLLGVGAGFTAVRMLGLTPVARAGLRRFIAEVRALCRGETLDGPAGPLRLAFGKPAACPPVLLAAGAPKMLELAGEVADGVILQGRAQAGAVLDQMLARIRAGREAAGRLEQPFRITLGTAAAVHDERARALAAVKAHVAVSLLNPPWEVSAAAREAQAAVRAVYNYADHMNASANARFAAAVPDAAVPEFALAGTPDECIAQARALFAAGVDEIIVRPYPVGDEPRAAMVEAIARRVMRPLLERR